MEVRSHVLLAAARRGAMGAKKHFLLAQVRLHNLKTSNIMIAHVHMLAIPCYLGSVRAQCDPLAKRASSWLCTLDSDAVSTCFRPSPMR